MNELALKTRQEVLLMLKRLSFNSREGAYVEGELAAVEIVPKRTKDADLCDLHFRIISYHSVRQAPAEVLAGAREACEEAAFDSDPAVRFAARLYLDSLKSPDRVHPGDMEGLVVSLYMSERGAEPLAESLTDRHGEIWFSDVSLSAVCRLTMAEEEVMSVSESAKVDLAAESLDEPPRVGSGSLVFTLFARRVVALLEELQGGGAVLTVETEAEECGGATVRFAWGRESVEVKLEPAETGGVWSGQCRLTHSFKELTAEAPAFELIPPRQKGAR